MPPRRSPRLQPKPLPFLPDEVVACVLSFLPPAQLLHTAMVTCRQWRQTALNYTTELSFQEESSSRYLTMAAREDWRALHSLELVGPLSEESLMATFFCAPRCGFRSVRKLWLREMDSAQQLPHMLRCMRIDSLVVEDTTLGFILGSCRPQLGRLTSLEVLWCSAFDKQDLCNLHLLERLSIRGGEVELQDDELAEILRTCPKLSYLGLYGSDSIKGEGLQPPRYGARDRAAERPVGLTQLTLDNMIGLTDEGVLGLAGLFPRLTHLSIRERCECFADDGEVVLLAPRSVAVFAASCPALAVFDYTNAAEPDWFDDDDFRLMASAIPDCELLCSSLMLRDGVDVEARVTPGYPQALSFPLRQWAARRHTFERVSHHIDMDD